MVEQRATRTIRSITAVRAVLALACAILVLSGALHDAQHAASDSIESCAACLQFDAVATAAAAVDLTIEYGELRIAPRPTIAVTTRTPSGTRQSRAPPLS